MLLHGKQPTRMHWYTQSRLLASTRHHHYHAQTMITSRIAKLEGRWKRGVHNGYLSHEATRGPRRIKRGPILCSLPRTCQACLTVGSDCGALPRPVTGELAQLAVSVHTPYCALGGAANSTDLEARSRGSSLGTQTPVSMRC